MPSKPAIVDETPELIEKALADFEVELEKIDDKPEVLDANERCPEQLDDKFKLLFIRCEAFNAKVSL